MSPRAALPRSHRKTTGPALAPTGVAVTDLRPGGSAEFPDLGIEDVRTVGVVSESGYVAAGTQLVVRESRGARVVVRAVT